MSTAKVLYTRVAVRWQIQFDLPDILEIERRNNYYPWSREDYATAMRGRCVIGMVAERGPRVVGHMLYRLDRDRIELLRFAVHPDFQRQGVGHQMMTRLRGKLSPDGRGRIVFDVPETALPLQLFLRHEGFLASVVFPGAFADGREDAYRFAYEVAADAPRLPSPLADWPPID